MIVASGFMVGGSVIAASFATSVVQLTVILALGFGNYSNEYIIDSNMNSTIQSLYCSIVADNAMEKKYKIIMYPLFRVGFYSVLFSIMSFFLYFTGPGISFAYILSKSMIGRCFKTNYATANGIGQIGSPLGLIIMAPLVQLLLDTYGWRGAMLLLGEIGLHLVVCGGLLRQL